MNFTADRVTSAGYDKPLQVTSELDSTTSLPVMTAKKKKKFYRDRDGEMKSVPRLVIDVGGACPFDVLRACVVAGGVHERSDECVR